MKKWKIFIDRKKSQEYISIQIIFNRWKCFTEEKIYKSERQALALNHRVWYLSKQVLYAWMKIKNDSKGRLMYPHTHTKINTFSSNWHLRKKYANLGHYACQNKLMDFQRDSTSRSPFSNKSLLYNATTSNERRLSAFGCDFVPSRLNFINHDSEYLLSSRPPPLHRRSCVTSPTRTSYEYRIDSSKSTIPGKTAFRHNFINRDVSKAERKLPGVLRPIEQLMSGTSRVGQRKPHMPSWILNDLSNQKMAHDSELTGKIRLHSTEQENKTRYPNAEPKYLSRRSSFVQSKSRKREMKSWSKESYRDSKEEK